MLTYWCDFVISSLFVAQMCQAKLYQNLPMDTSDLKSENVRREYEAFQGFYVFSYHRSVVAHLEWATLKTEKQNIAIKTVTNVMKISRLANCLEHKCHNQIPEIVLQHLQ